MGVQISPWAQMKEKNIHEVFVISILLKALNAFLQIFFGLVLLVTGKATDWVLGLANNELIEDPHDFIATHIATIISHVSPGSQFFGAWYLLIHGFIKIILSVALIKNKIWAYPASIVALLAFILYQVVRFFHTHSIFLVLLTLFDLLVLWLVAHEYRYLLRKKK